MTVPNLKKPHSRANSPGSPFIVAYNLLASSTFPRLISRTTRMYWVASILIFMPQKMMNQAKISLTSSAQYLLFRMLTAS